ncbi:MAG: hypothetical protein COA42_01475 [Alteromonadaceae bacterium]|nr:MAG: hypothetical protein COA42_01475 [Alteromonadaceae bacterium]
MGNRATPLFLFFTLFALCLSAKTVTAQQCDEIFTDGISVNDDAGLTTLLFAASIQGGDANLDTPNLVDFAFFNACSGNACAATGVAAESTSPPFQTGTGADGPIVVAPAAAATFPLGDYTDITVNSQSELTFSQSGTYFINTLTTEWRSELTLPPGDYWINGNLSIGQRAEIIPASPGTVRIFVNGNVNLGGDSSTAQFASEDLLIYATGSIDVNFRAEFNGFLYSASGTATVFWRAEINGGISAANITMQAFSTVIYNPTALAAGNFDTFCSGGGGTTVDHLQLSLATNASTCAANTMTISICANMDCSAVIDDYTGIVSLSTTTAHGNWSVNSGLGTLTPNPDNDNDGVATYAFNDNDNGIVSLDLANTHAETLTVNASDSVDSATGTSNNTTFSDNAFVITNIDSLANDVIAGRDHSFRVQMMRRAISGDPNSDCAVASNYNTADVKAWISRDVDDPSGIAPSLISATETQALADSEPALINLSLPFINGSADFSLDSSDVGKYQIAFKDDGLGFSDQDILGNSATLVVRPFGLDLQVNTNPAAADSSGAIFTPAGNNFTVSVRPVAWSSIDDSNDDGQPDNHADNDPGNGNADLSDNTTVASFGQETPAASVQLTSQLDQPTTGTDPGLQDGDGTIADGRILDGFSGGVNNSASTNQVYYPEVGIIEISANLSLTTYLGEVRTITGDSGYVGRFYPNKFAIMEDVTVGALVFDSQVNEACTTFSYLGQNFSTEVYIAALNSFDNLTRNYRDDFAKLDASDTFVWSAVNNGAVDLSSRITLLGVNSIDWAIDVNNDTTVDYGYGLIDSNLQFNRIATPDGPYANVRFGLLPSDDDGVTIPTADYDLEVDGIAGNDSVEIDTLDSVFRFGRLQIGNAHGPETVILPVPFTTQHWDGVSEYIDNLSDSCTVIAASDISFDDPPNPLSTDANRTVAVGGGTSTGTFISLIPATSISFVGGDAGLSFSAPGNGNTGNFPIDVNLTNYAWLRFDWDGNNNFNDDTALPSAEVDFGHFRGHDRIIYWREK